MSAVWTIRDANDVEKSVADWGLCEVIRERINQAPDVVTFRAEGTPSDADPIFAHGSTVKLFQNGVPWFYGRVVQVPGQVLVTVRKVTGGANLFASVRGDTITSNGFTADLSAAADAATYALDWLVIV